MHENLHTYSGFTILELIIALGILSITISIAVFHTHKSTNLSTQTKSLLDQINYYSLISQTLNCDLSLQFNSNTFSISSTSDTSCSFKPKTYIIPKPIRIINANFSSLSQTPNILILRRTGTSTPGTITLSNSQNKLCQILISLRGANRFICN